MTESPSTSSAPLQNTQDKKTKKEPKSNVYSFFMKLYFYQGLIIYIPYIIIRIYEYSSFPIMQKDMPFIIWIGLITLFGILIMDNYGIRSTHIDKIRKKFTFWVSIIGIIPLIAVFTLALKMWDNENRWLITCYMLGFIVYISFGWFFVRAERGFTPTEVKPSFTQTMFILFICGILYISELLINGALILGLIISLAIYPILLLNEGFADATPRPDPNKITTKYLRVTLWNFTIDMIKAICIIFAVIVFSYSGAVVLYPDPVLYGPGAWRDHLALVCIIAAAAVLLFSQMQKVYPLSVIILILGLNLIWAVFNYFGAFQFRWIIGVINGFSLAGVYYFIEQKMNESTNVRALPGLFYYGLAIIVTLAMVVRTTPEMDRIVELARGLIAVLGITYVLGYIHEKPKPKSYVWSIVQ